MAKTDVTVRELVDKVRRGELLLPEMQRRYVWTSTRVRDLLDSLYRGYPSGTILVWETDQDVEVKKLPIHPSQSPTTSQKLLLLDGQQRITSLAAVMNGQPVTVRNKKKPIDILFNLEHPEGPPATITEVNENNSSEDLEELENEEEEENVSIHEELKNRAFVVASKSLKNDPAWIPVSQIFIKSDKELLRPLGINSDNERWDRYSERLQRVRKIADYPYVVQILEKSLSYEEVTEIFVRVNSLGIKLRGSDLALAQITSRWKGFTDIIEKFAEEFKHDEDYILDTGLPVRTLVVFATQQSRFRTVGRLDLEKLKSSWEVAKESLRFTVNFLRSNAKIEDLSTISSPFLLIPIAVKAYLNKGNLNKSEEKQLLKWFYIAHMRGHYSGSSESILDADLSVLFRGGNLDDLLAQLEQYVKLFTIDQTDIANKSKRSPFFTMLYFVLKQKGAKDWWNGISLSENQVGRSYRLQHHHIFPKSLLKREGYDKKEINEIANMAFIAGKTNKTITNKEPFDYFHEIIKNRDEEALLSQLIPIDHELWKIENYRKFLEFRRKAIADIINEFISELG